MEDMDKATVPDRAMLQEALRDVLQSELGQLSTKLEEALRGEMQRQFSDLYEKKESVSRQPSRMGLNSASLPTQKGAAESATFFRPMQPFMSEEFLRMMKDETDYVHANKLKPRRRSVDGMPQIVEAPGARTTSHMEEAPPMPRQTGSSEEAREGLQKASSIVDDGPRQPETLESVHPFSVQDDGLSEHRLVDSDSEHVGNGTEPGKDRDSTSLDSNGHASPALMKSPDVESPKGVKSIELPGMTKAEHAMDMGVVRRQSTESFAGPEATLQERLRALVKSERFEGVVSLMIFASATHVGLQTDHIARNVTNDVPTGFRVVDIIFLIFFTGEVILRLVAYGWRKYFTTHGWAWNAFDFFLVCGQILEELANLIPSADDGSGGGIKFPSAFVLRVVRVLRCVRTIRLLQVMRFADELRLLVSCIMHSLKAFSWSLMLIGMLIYMAAIYFATAVQDYRVSAPENDIGAEELADLAGSVPQAALALFQALTGGMDWNDIAFPMMEHVAWWWGIIFVLYISFMLFAVLNVVTAVFVENALERSEQVKQIQKLNKASRLFKCLDLDGSGQITCEEIMNHLDADHVQEFFRSIDVHATEARCLFELLDNNGGGSLDFEEFLSGCMRLQGPARSVDLVRALNEIKRGVDNIRVHMDIPVPVNSSPSLGS